MTSDSPAASRDPAKGDPATRQTLGQLLKSARESRGLTIAQIAGETRIGQRVLESIERDDYRKLPGGIFNRAFIRAYAREVGVDAEYGVVLYERTQREQSGVHLAPHDHKVEALVVAAGGLLALLLAVALWYLWSHLGTSS